MPLDAQKKVPDVPNDLRGYVTAVTGFVHSCEGETGTVIQDEPVDPGLSNEQVETHLGTTNEDKQICDSKEIDSVITLFDANKENHNVISTVDTSQADNKTDYCDTEAECYTVVISSDRSQAYTTSNNTDALHTDTEANEVGSLQTEIVSHGAVSRTSISQVESENQNEVNKTDILKTEIEGTQMTISETKMESSNMDNSQIATYFISHSQIDEYTLQTDAEQYCKDKHSRELLESDDLTIMAYKCSGQQDGVISETLPAVAPTSENDIHVGEKEQVNNSCSGLSSGDSNSIKVLASETDQRKHIVYLDKTTGSKEEMIDSQMCDKMNKKILPKLASRIATLQRDATIDPEITTKTDVKVVSYGVKSNPVLTIIEASLLELSSENQNWTQAIVNLSKSARSASKTNQKEVIAVLVKNRIADKFISFVDINGINFASQSTTVENDSLKYWPSFKRFINMFWILCDSSLNFCQYILNSKLFEYLMVELKVISSDTHSLCDKRLYLLKAILGIFHNISRHIPSSKWVFRNEGLVAVLRLFLSCDIVMVRVKALMILSYITSETENEIINSDDENFAFIIQVLTDALESDSHVSAKYGMCAAEVLKGLCNLAVNDENKIRIVKNGALSLYEQLLVIGSKEEKKLTTTCLWNLAFHHYNKQRMRDMKGIMEKLRALELPEGCSYDEEIYHAARGTIWELENTSSATINRNYSSSSAEKESQQPHIMISYQWDSQSIMVKVKDKLRQAGYKVWMDVEHMTGSTLEAMALAVEKAAVVVICMSQKYKDSPNCRTEAEYVYRLRKDFVPLRLQEDYVPDGWLGIMVGTRLYFDIYTEEKVDVQIPRLAKELRDRGKISPYDIGEKDFVVPTRMTSRESVPILSTCSMETYAWSCVEVRNWLKSVGCQELIDRFPAVDGSLLLELQQIQSKAPEFFYTLLKSELNLTLTEILRFSRCLRNNLPK